MNKLPDIGVYAYIAGTRYVLRNVKGYVIEKITGLGIPNVRRQFSRGAFQQGKTDLGYRSDSRLIGITWALVDNDLWGLDDLRQELYSIFRPREDDPVSLRFVLPSKRIRQADVNLIDVMEAEDTDSYGAQRVTAVFEAADPRLYDPRQQTVDFNLITYNDGWTIPWPIPWPIGQSAVNTTEVINYASGDRLADQEFPVIRIFGPLRNVIVENLTTGESLDFTAEGGVAIGLGEFVEIDLSYGVKTAVDQNGNSVERFLTDESDLATWHLSYNTELLDSGNRSTGSNTIRVRGNAASTVTRVEIAYFNRYVAA